MASSNAMEGTLSPEPTEGVGLVAMEADVQIAIDDQDNGTTKVSKNRSQSWSSSLFNYSPNKQTKSRALSVSDHEERINRSFFSITPSLKFKKDEQMFQVENDTDYDKTISKLQVSSVPVDRTVRRSLSFFRSFRKGHNRSKSMPGTISNTKLIAQNASANQNNADGDDYMSTKDKLIDLANRVKEYIKKDFRSKGSIEPINIVCPDSTKRLVAAGGNGNSVMSQKGSMDRNKSPQKYDHTKHVKSQSWAGTVSFDEPFSDSSTSYECTALQGHVEESDQSETSSSEGYTSVKLYAKSSVQTFGEELTDNDKAAGKTNDNIDSNVKEALSDTYTWVKSQSNPSHDNKDTACEDSFVLQNPGFKHLHQSGCNIASQQTPTDLNSELDTSSSSRRNSPEKVVLEFKKKLVKFFNPSSVSERGTMLSQLQVNPTHIYDNDGFEASCES